MFVRVGSAQTAVSACLNAAYQKPGNMNKNGPVDFAEQENGGRTQDTREKGGLEPKTKASQVEHQH